jgi:hypothetical protein
VNAFLGFGFGFSLDSGCNWFLQFWLCGNSLSERGGSLTALWEVVRSALLRFTGSLGGGGGGGGVVLVQLGNFLCQQIIYRNIPSYTLRPSTSSSTGDAFRVGAFLLRPWSLSWGNVEVPVRWRITVESSHYLLE